MEATVHRSLGKTQQSGCEIRKDISKIKIYCKFLEKKKLKNQNGGWESAETVIGLKVQRPTISSFSNMFKIKKNY